MSRGSRRPSGTPSEMVTREDRTTVRDPEVPCLLSTVVLAEELKARDLPCLRGDLACFCYQKPERYRQKTAPQPPIRVHSNQPAVLSSCFASDPGEDVKMTKTGMLLQGACFPIARGAGGWGERRERGFCYRQIICQVGKPVPPMSGRRRGHVQLAG